MIKRVPVITPRFKRVFSKKPVEMQAAIAACIKRVLEDPMHPGLNIHKMQGLAEEVWEAYVDHRGNRVTFHYEADQVVFRNNCNHSILTRRP